MSSLHQVIEAKVYEYRAYVYGIDFYGINKTIGNKYRVIHRGKLDDFSKTHARTNHWNWRVLFETSCLTPGYERKQFEF